MDVENKTNCCFLFPFEKVCDFLYTSFLKSNIANYNKYISLSQGNL